MKKFIKNTILTILIIYFILNLVYIIELVIKHYGIMNQIDKVSKQVATEITTTDEMQQALASFYYYGYGDKIEMQVGMIGLSTILGITVGVIITTEEKSRIKLILNYFLGLLVIPLIITIFYMYEDTSFFSELLYNIESIWKWYTLVFALLYAIKIYISNKDVKKLNDILKDKVNKKQV